MNLVVLRKGSTNDGASQIALDAYRSIRYLDGIDSPVDGQRTYANNERLRDYLLPFAAKAWDDVSDPAGTLPFSHDHYVKVWQLGKPVIAADYILLDECFPAGTMVETSVGSVPILNRSSRPRKLGGVSWLGFTETGH